MMRPYWIVFERSSKPTVFNLGYGVTANSEQDARHIVAAAVPGAPAIVNITPIKDIVIWTKGVLFPIWATGFAEEFGFLWGMKFQTSG